MSNYDGLKSCLNQEGFERYLNCMIYQFHLVLGLNDFNPGLGLDNYFDLYVECKRLCWKDFGQNCRIFYLGFYEFYTDINRFLYTVKQVFQHVMNALAP